MSVSKMVLFLLMYCLASVVVVDAQLNRTYASCIVLDQGAEFIMHWQIVGQTLEVAIEAPSAGWIALGFSQSPINGMIDNGAGADILMGFVKPSGPCANGCLNSYNPTSYPPDAGNPAISAPPTGTLVSGSISGGRMYIEFDRPLVGPKSTIVPTSPHNLIWAYNDAPNSVADDTGTIFTKHPSNTRNTFVGHVFATPSPTCMLTGAPIVGGNEFVSQDGKYIAKWSSTSTEISFELTVETQGWVGIGFSQNQQMTNTDTYVGWVHNDVVYVSDRTIGSQRDMPPVDAQQDVSKVSGFKTATHTTVRFTRPIVSTDPADENLDVAKNMLWAYGGAYDDVTKVFTEHTDKGLALDVSFTSPCQAAPIAVSGGAVDGLLMGHIVGMALAWALLVPVGTYVARYFKAKSTRWFPGHVVLQCVGLLLTVVGFALVFVSRGSFTSGPHQILGVIVFALALIQGLFGALSHFCFKPGRDRPPLFPDVIHWWLGRGVQVLAVVAIALGIYRFNELFVTGPAVAPWVLFGLWVAAAIVCFVVGEVSARKNHQMPGDAHRDDELGLQTQSGKSTDGATIAFVVLAILSVCLVGGMLGTLFASASSGGVSTGSLITAPTEVIQTCVTMPKYALPSNKATHYTCYGFKFPTGQPFHAYYFEPIIENPQVHHILVYDTGSTLISDIPYECNMPSGSQPFYAWAVGGPAFEAPSDSGFVMPTFGAIQIHYDNPSLTTNVTDSSGVRIRYTNILRPKESGFFRTGVRTSSINLPPGRDLVEITSTCTLPSFPLSFQPRVWAAALHMHKRGKQMVVEHHRKQMGGGYTRQNDIHCNPFYDFNKQEFVPVEPNVILQGEDRFITRCIFETKDDVANVLGGEESSDEMCLSFLAYDPLVSGGGSCYSTMTLLQTVTQPLCFNSSAP